MDNDITGACYVQVLVYVIVSIVIGHDLSIGDLCLSIWAVTTRLLLSVFNSGAAY